MNKNKKKILIVDDEKDFVEMVKWNLEKTGGYKVTVETESKYALDVAKVVEPDLILLDVMMPGMDGADVEYQIKKEEKLKDIPIIFLTAIVKEEEIESEDGAIAGHVFLAKPVTLKQLVDCIEKNIKK
ncbi:MAG: response regulator [Candidatus Omnitrophica bacterium]|nr:response regulator [Candidatus Omnitrophota bacterium]